MKKLDLKTLYQKEINNHIQFADILLEDVPWVFLWHKGKYSITQSFVSGSFPKLIFNAEKYINWEKKSG